MSKTYFDDARNNKRENEKKVLKAQEFYCLWALGTQDMVNFWPHTHNLSTYMMGVPMFTVLGWAVQNNFQYKPKLGRASLQSRTPPPPTDYSIN